MTAAEALAQLGTTVAEVEDAWRVNGHKLAQAAAWDLGELEQ